MLPHNAPQHHRPGSMDLKQIEYFVKVAELGSFSRAALALDVAQPALSKQVRALEVEMRQSLLTRTGRGAVLTESGKVLFNHGVGILHQLELAREEMTRVRGTLAGRVAIGLPPTIGRVMAAQLYREARQRMPEASIAITEGSSYGLLESLRTGRLDVAFIYDVSSSPDIAATVIATQELLLVGRATQPGAQEDPVSLAELAELPLVLPTRPNTLRLLIEGELAGIGRQPKVAVEVDGVPTILDLVGDGAGCTVLTQRAIETSGRAGLYSLRRIQPALHSSLTVATSAHRPVTLTQNALLQLAVSLARTLLVKPA